MPNTNQRSGRAMHVASHTDGLCIMKHMGYKTHDFAPVTLQDKHIVIDNVGFPLPEIGVALEKLDWQYMHEPDKWDADLRVMLRAYMYCKYISKGFSYQAIAEAVRCGVEIGRVSYFLSPIQDQEDLMANVLFCAKVPDTGEFPECRPWTMAATEVLFHNTQKLRAWFFKELELQNEALQETNSQFMERYHLNNMKEISRILHMTW